MGDGNGESWVTVRQLTIAQTDGATGDDVLTAIMWAENGDHPCRIVAYGRKISAADKAWSWSDRHLFDDCKVGGDGKTVELQPASGKVVRAIRAIRVCTSENADSSQNRLKGIEIWAAKISKTGEVVNDDATEKVYHPNCKTWQKKVECPAGEVAVSLVATHDDKDFRGLALECAKVVPK